MQVTLLAGRQRARKLFAAVIIASPVCVPTVVEAIGKTWLSSNGNWSTAGNWSGGVIPAAGGDVVMVNSDLVNRTITFNVGTLSLVSLQLNNGLASGGVAGARTRWDTGLSWLVYCAPARTRARVKISDAKGD